jgi:hypothetical protein
VGGHRQGRRPQGLSLARRGSAFETFLAKFSVTCSITSKSTPTPPSPWVANPIARGPLWVIEPRNPAGVDGAPLSFVRIGVLGAAVLARGGAELGGVAVTVGAVADVYQVACRIPNLLRDLFAEEVVGLIVNNFESGDLTPAEAAEKLAPRRVADSGGGSTPGAVAPGLPTDPAASRLTRLMAPATNGLAAVQINLLVNPDRGGSQSSPSSSRSHSAALYRKLSRCGFR